MRDSRDVVRYVQQVIARVYSSQIAQIVKRLLVRGLVWGHYFSMRTDRLHWSKTLLLSETYRCTIRPPCCSLFSQFIVQLSPNSSLVRRSVLPMLCCYLSPWHSSLNMTLRGEGLVL